MNLRRVLKRIALAMALMTMMLYSLGGCAPTAVLIGLQILSQLTTSGTDTSSSSGSGSLISQLIGLAT